ncbi:MAG: hypothetical protein DRP84_01150 [Spirochaetes bacterium]|nr:MAG: hypothetical protein DRP84_01150 [Spirochaetota bacterium]
MERKHQIPIIIFLSIFLLNLPFSSVNAGKTSYQKKERQKLEQYIEEGKALYEKGNYQGALEKWTEALKIDPWNSEVKNLIDDVLKKISNFSDELNRGFNYLDNNELDKAKKIFDKLSKEINPEDKKNYELLVKGITLLKEAEKKKEFENLLKKGDSYLNKKEIDLAEETFNEAQKLFPTDERLAKRFQKIEKIKEEIKKEERIAQLKSRARELFDQNKFQESKARWEEVLSLKPGDEEAMLYISKINFKEKEKERILALGKSYFDTGVNLYKQGRYNEAMDQFENSIAVGYQIEASQKYIDSIKEKLFEIEKKKNEDRVEKIAKYLKEGIKLYNLNKFREALKVLNDGLKLDPDNTQVKEYIVIVSIALKRQEEKRVPMTSPFYPLVENLKRLAKNAYEKGNYTDAIKYYEEILLIFPFNEYAKLNLTKVLKKTDPELASDILSNMIKEAEDLLCKGKKRESLEKLKTVLDVDPNNKKAGLLYRKLKSEMEASKKIVTRDMINRAKQLYNQGVEFYKKEDLKDAISKWKEAISIYPDFVEARISLAKAETKLRNLKLIEAGKGQAESESISIAIKRHYIDGLNYYMSGLYKEAISEWKELLKLNPEDESFKKRIYQNIKRAEQRLEMRG